MIGLIIKHACNFHKEEHQVCKTMEVILGRREFLNRLPYWLRAKVGVDHQEILMLIEMARRLIGEGALVLDAGAGEGQYKRFFSHARYVALDFAQGDITWDYSGLDVIGDLLHIPLRDGVFDAVICTQVLEHVPKPWAVLREMNRVLRIGGHLFVSAPQWWFQHQKPYDYYRYTSFGLRYLLEQSGFEIQFIKPMGGYFWFLSVVLRALHAHLFPTRGPLWWQRVIHIPRRLVQIFFWSIVPLFLFYLDGLDRDQDFTLGYVCHCVKQENVRTL